MAQHLAPLLGQGGELSCDLLLSRDADLKDLLGFLPGGQAAQGRQAQGDASRILSLAHPMALGHPEKRFDGIGTDRQADVIEPECRSGLQLEVKLAPCGRTICLARRTPWYPHYIRDIPPWA
jgi:hypothetical protein